MWAGCGPAPAPVTIKSTVRPPPDGVNVAVPLMPELFCCISCNVVDCPWADASVVAAKSASIRPLPIANVHCRCRDIVDPLFDDSGVVPPVLWVHNLPCPSASQPRPRGDVQCG